MHETLAPSPQLCNAKLFHYGVIPSFPFLLLSFHTVSCVHLNLNSKLNPSLRDSGRHQRQAAAQKHGASPHLCMQVAAVVIRNQCSSERRARQARKRHNRESHAHPRPRLLQVRSQAGQHGREQPLNTRRCQSDDHGERIQALLRMHPRPCEQHHPGRQRKRDDEVQRPGEAIADERRNYSGYVPHAVENEQQVERVRVRQPYDISAECTNLLTVSMYYQKKKRLGCSRSRRRNKEPKN